MSDNYLEINRASWNKRTLVHSESEFYNTPAFIAGKNSLKQIELGLLGDISGKKILHLQCHFGQDSISLARMGAEVTGVDLSNEAIDRANELAKQCDVNCRFIESDVYSLRTLLDEEFDMVFTSYGVIGWLPDIDKWASVIAHFLKPEGKLVFVEFHPVVWMYDDDFNGVSHRYFNSDPIIETETGTYADRSANISSEYVMWNHGLSEVITALLDKGMRIDQMNEYDYSPYNCFNGTVEIETDKYRIEKLGNKIPMTYSICATLCS